MQTMVLGRDGGRLAVLSDGKVLAAPRVDTYGCGQADVSEERCSARRCRAALCVTDHTATHPCYAAALA